MSPRSTYPKHGKTLKVHGSPWHFSETPARIGIAPELGADNDEVLGELGYSAEQIARSAGAEDRLNPVPVIARSEATRQSPSSCAHSSTEIAASLRSSQ